MCVKHEVIQMLFIDYIKKQLAGTCKAGDIKRLGLIKASIDDKTE